MTTSREPGLRDDTDKPGSHTQLVSEPELRFLRPLSARGRAQAVGQASPLPATGSHRAGHGDGHQWTLIHLFHILGGTCSDGLFGQSFWGIGSGIPGVERTTQQGQSLLSLPHQARQDRKCFEGV